MTIWIDEQIAPAIASFISITFKIKCFHVSEVVGTQSSDLEIFVAARKADIIILSKDVDFVNLYSKLGAPSKIIHLKCGNISNKDLKAFKALKLSVSINEAINNDFTTLE